MSVRPDEISASRAPSTSPLNSCDTKFGQLTTNKLAHRSSSSPAASGVFAEVAAERVGLLHQGLPRNDLKDLPEVLLVLHVARLLAPHDDDRPDELVILGAEMHVTYGRREGF